MMTLKHLYIGIEILNMTANQRNTLRDELRRLGKDDSGPVHRRMQPYPVRPDGLAAIFEAVFNENDLTIAAWKNRLANLFSINPESITHDVSTPNFGVGTSQVVTFSYGDTPRLRACVFGGVSAIWEQSRLEILAYLVLHRSEWEVGEE